MMTIIILLILAVVSIKAVTGDGIISHAKNARAEYEKAQTDEQITLQDYLDQININDENSNVLKGRGTESEPYLISSIEDLILFAYDVNSGNTYQGKYVKLEKDLDFTLDSSYENASRTNYSAYGYSGNLKTALTTGEGFIPIGTGKEGTVKAFTGTFDGNGKTINNLKISKENNINTDIGLFRINYGIIKNLGVKNCDIDVNFKSKVDLEINCGSICGYNYGEINSCWASGNIDASEFNNDFRIGGIVGDSYGKDTVAIIKNCYSKVNINANKQNELDINTIAIAGILGGSVNTTIEGCCNFGTISTDINNSKGFCVGGIVGYGSLNVINCYNVANITGKGNCSTVGGIVGFSVSELIKGCYNIGNLECICETSAGTIGGIIGGAPLNQMSNCYNLGTVKYSGNSGDPFFGGVCGSMCYANVDQCCNMGDIIYEGESTKYVGALIGQMLGSLSNSYILNNTNLNGIARNYTSTPEPTKVDTVSEMPTVLEIVGDAFKEDTNNINNGYPILKWQ